MVELVLWIPVLLGLSALMVHFGAAAKWRARGEWVARAAAWNARYPRSAAAHPRVDKALWPAEAQVGIQLAPPLESLAPDQAAPFANLHAGRAAGTGGLDFRDGVLAGTASIEQRLFAFSPRGVYRSGSIRHPLLDGAWQAAQLGLPAGDIRRWPLFFSRPPVAIQTSAANTTGASP